MKSLVRTLRTACLLALVVHASVAHSKAKKPADQARAAARVAALRAYPLSLVDRPLTLPVRMVQLTAELGLGNTADVSSAGQSEPGSQSLSVAFGVDVGLPHRAQVGLFVDAPTAPLVGAVLLLANGQLGLSRWASLRLDVGVQVVDASWETALGSEPGAVIGLGAPIKVRFAKRFAFVSGSSSARGFGAPALTSYAHGGVYAFTAAVTESSDLLTVFVAKNDFATATTNPVYGSFFVPVGLAYAPQERVSLTLRTGYRMIFNRTGNLLHYVPLALDVQVAVSRRFDLGVTAHVDGFVGATRYATPARYGDTQQYVLWFAARL